MNACEKFPACQCPIEFGTRCSVAEQRQQRMALQKLASMPPHPPTNRTWLGSNIRGYRKHIGITQDVLAAALNIGRSRLNSYENHAAEPGITDAVAIAKHFEVSIDDLLRTNINWEVYHAS